jgi:hypothetical protein
VTSEKRFAQSHAGFWNVLLPMEEAYIRARNASLRRCGSALRSMGSPDQHGIINEFAFRLFLASVRVSDPPEYLPLTIVDECANETISYIKSLSHFSRTQMPAITRYDRQEAMFIAATLFSYFRSRPWSVFLPTPAFPGCGWLDGAEGDVLADKTLFEIKAGSRLFRGIDLRQILCYCALNFSAKSYEIDTICLLNPRSGTYFNDNLEHLCYQTAGTNAASVLGEIVNYVSEPFGDAKADSFV